jgi:hydrogenase maturation protein HypF
MMDDTPLWQAARRDLDGIAPEVMALRFHAGLATSFARQARRLVEDGRAKAVALSGGCFQNALLLDLTLEGPSTCPSCTTRAFRPMMAGLRSGRRWWRWQPRS